MGVFVGGDGAVNDCLRVGESIELDLTVIIGIVKMIAKMYDGTEAEG